MCVKLVIYKDCNKMHGQQNIKTVSFIFTLVTTFNLKPHEQCELVVLLVYDAEVPWDPEYEDSSLQSPTIVHS